MQDWVFRLGFQHTNETRNLKAVVNKIRLPLIASRQQISKAVWAEEYSARWSHFFYLLEPVVIEEPTLHHLELIHFGNMKFNQSLLAAL